MENLGREDGRPDLADTGEANELPDLRRGWKGVRLGCGGTSLRIELPDVLVHQVQPLELADEFGTEEAPQRAAVGRDEPVESFPPLSPRRPSTSRMP